MWECNGGQVLAGEDSEVAIIRELSEELGINLSDGIFLKTIKKENKFKDLYLFYQDVNDFKFVDQEVVDVKWVTINEYLDMLNHNLVVPNNDFYLEDYNNCLKIIDNNFHKKIRHAVRTYIIEDNKILAIKNKCIINKNFYDIPGGKIEDNENAFEAAKREFMEETGMKIDNLCHKGTMVVEYPDRIYHFTIFISNIYMGNPQEFDENFAMWIDIDELLAKDKKLPVVYIIKKLLQEREVNVRIFADEKNNVITMKNYL